MRTSGPYSAASASGSTPYSSVACDASCSRRSRCSFLEISVPWAVFTTASSSAETVVTWARTVLRVPLAAAVAASAAARRSLDSASDDSAADTAAAAPAATARATAPCAARCRRRMAARSLAARSAVADAASESARPLMARSRSSTVRTSRRASISASRAAPARRVELGPLLVGLLVLELRVAGPVLVGLGLGQLGLQLGELGQVLLGAALRRADRGVEPLGLVGGRPRGPGQPPEPPGDLGRGGVGGAQPAADLLQHLPGLVLRLGRLGQGLGRRLARHLGRGQLGGRVIGGGAHVEQRLRPGRPAVRPVRADQVAVGGHAAKIGIVPNEPGRLGQVRHHHDVGEQLADRARQLGRAGHQVDRPPRAGGKSGARVAVGAGGASRGFPGPPGP